MVQTMRTLAPGAVFDRQIHAERRRIIRLPEIHVRRRRGQVRLPYLHTERRRARNAGFDVAATLELNLDRYPTKTAMLTLLRIWLNVAEREGVDERRLAYVCVLRDAINVMQDALDPLHAVALLNVTIGGVRVIGTITTPEEDTLGHGGDDKVIEPDRGFACNGFVLLPPELRTSHAEKH